MAAEVAEALVAIKTQHAGYSVRAVIAHAAGLDLEELFLFETKRRVMKDRTLSLHGQLYEADATLIGCTVTVRYDPAAPPSRALQVVHEGRPAGLATPLDAYANTAVKRGRIERGDPEPPRSRLSIRRLKEEE